jgi:patatin-like phospholipase/acyl hydrolase
MDDNIMLCLDGGGVRGLFACNLLIKLRCKLKKQLTTLFTSCIGISIGAVISAMLAIGKLDEVSYTDTVAILCTIFDVRKQPFSPLFNTTYDGRKKTDALKSFFGECVMGDCKIDLGIVCCTLSGQTVLITNTSHPKTPIAHVLDCATAAVSVFPSVPLDGNLLIDYGIVSNNVSLHAINFAEDWKKTKFLSISCLNPITNSTDIQPIDFPKMGILAWATLNLYDIISGNGDNMIHITVSQLCGDKYLRIQHAVKAQLDDVRDSTLNAISDVADQTWTTMGETIKIFVMK